MTVSSVERMLAVPGPMRGSASRKAVIGTTVQTAARPAIDIQATGFRA